MLLFETLVVRPNQQGEESPPHQIQASPSWRDPTRPTAHDRFRHIFRDHWHTWCDLRLEVEVPPDQRPYDCKTIERLILCRDPSAGYARYICPGCGFDRRVPFSCKTRFCPSCGKVRVDNWVDDIARDLFDVPGRPFGRLVNASLDVTRYQERVSSPWRLRVPSHSGLVSFQGT